MLTILETIYAIKTINTEHDVIINACKSVLGIKPTTDYRDTEELSINILEHYEAVKSDELIVALTLAVGSMAALCCKPGKEAVMLQGIAEGIKSQFVQILRRKMMERVRTEPLSALREILTMIEALDGTKAEK